MVKWGASPGPPPLRFVSLWQAVSGKGLFLQLQTVRLSCLSSFLNDKGRLLSLSSCCPFLCVGAEGGGSTLQTYRAGGTPVTFPIGSVLCRC